MTETLGVRLRRADPPDAAATRAVVVDAIGADDEETGRFLDALRSDGCVLGEWLAEDERGPLAHIAFSRVWLVAPGGTRRAGAMLTPLAVSRARQRAGIGTRLMQRCRHRQPMAGSAGLHAAGTRYAERNARLARGERECAMMRRVSARPRLR